MGILFHSLLSWMGTAIPFDLSHHRTRRVPVLCTFVLHTPSFGSPAAIPSLSVDTDYFHSFNATIRVKELHSPQRAFQSFLVESFQLRQLPTQTDSPVSSDDSVLPAILPLRSSASTYKYLQQSSNCLAKMQFSKTALLALCASSASAYSATKRTFAVNHFYGKGPLVVGRMDPIVNPGVASGHVHAVQGGNAFALSMTDDQALKSTCTSSRVKDDKSNYWTPALYFQDPKTGKLEPVEMFYMNVYYFFDATTDKIEAFPEGLRIFTGNPSLRTPPATGGEQITDHSDGTIQPIQWTCPRSNDNSPLYPADSNGRSGVGMQDPGNGVSGTGFPDKNCDGYASPLRADIHLPSCYNPAKGVQNYKENMDYPTNGKCPSGWKHVPHMFYEVYWNTPKFQDRWTPGQGKQPFVLANGDPTGYSLHADFINGWEPETLQQIIDNCDAGSAGMDKCPGLIGGLNDPSTSCNIESAINEVIDGVLDELPGNNPIGQWGADAAPAPAPAPVASSKSPVASAPAVSTPESTPDSTPEAPAPTPETTSKNAAQPVVTAKPTKIVDPAPSSPAEVYTMSPAPSAAASAPVVGGSNTMITSYVTVSDTVWTTVTAPGSDLDL